MDYISTRGQDGPLGFEQTLLSGLARDGGLYLPVEWPTLRPDEIAGMGDHLFTLTRYHLMAWKGAIRICIVDRVLQRHPPQQD